MRDDEAELMSTMINGSGSASSVGTTTGSYAYSTTLRRQPPPADGAFALPIHNPRHASPASHRRASDANIPAYGQGGLVESMGRFVRRVLGREDYEAVDLNDGTENGFSDLGAARKHRETPSGIYAHKTVEVSTSSWTLPDIQETIRDFDTHPEQGLSTTSLGPLLARYGPNEFELPPAESMAVKFAKGIYENPLILLLLASSAVSAIMGQYDDAVCVIITVIIVLTGKSSCIRTMLHAG